MPTLSQGPFAPGTISQDSAGKTWNNLSNVPIDDGASFANVSTTNFQVSNNILATNFGFAGIASIASIVGVVFTYKGKSGASTRESEGVVSLIKGGTVQGQNKATNTLLITLTQFSFGSSSDTWTLSLAPSDVVATTFGIAYGIQNLGNGSDSVFVDAFRLTVYYNVPTKFFFVEQGIDS